jgi:hypothetical protein
VAEAEGVTLACFSQEDVGVLWLACVTGEPPAQALQRAGWWDPQGPIGTGCRWSNESLALLGNQWPQSVVATRANARRLLALARQWDVAGRALRRLGRVLTAEPVARRRPTPARRHVAVINSQSGKGRAA